MRQLFFILYLSSYKNLEKGLVIKNTGSWYLVKTDDNRQIECKIKGNFRLKGIRSTNPIAVGDRVQISINAEGTAFITEIEDRKNYIIRRASNLSKQSHIIAANLNQCMLIVTVNYRYPRFPSHLHHVHRPFSGISRSLSCTCLSCIQQNRPVFG